MKGIPLFESSRPTPEEFKIEVADPNPFDKLYFRWISDYPPYFLSRSKLLQDGSANPGTMITYPVLAPCGDFSTNTPSPHRLVVVVADRPFTKDLSASDNPDYPYNSIDDAEGLWIMAGWTVTCP